MLDFAYSAFLVGSAAYILFSSRKEFPLMIVLHAILQYLIALGLWGKDMNYYLAVILLCFIGATTGLLIWARNIDYSKELQLLRLFVTLGQWTVLVAILLFIWIESPYSFQFTSSGGGSHLGEAHSSLHPFIKVSGNLILFTTMILFILGWGEKWKISQSIRDLGPIILYFFLVAILCILQAPLKGHPFV